MWTGPREAGRNVALATAVTLQLSFASDLGVLGLLPMSVEV
jgi:hypothetical protein